MSGRRGHGWPGAFPSVAFTRLVTVLSAGRQADRMFSPSTGSPEGWACLQTARHAVARPMEFPQPEEH